MASPRLKQCHIEFLNPFRSSVLYPAHIVLCGFCSLFLQIRSRSFALLRFLTSFVTYSYTFLNKFFDIAIFINNYKMKNEGFFYFNWSTVAKSSDIERDVCYPKYFRPLITILQFFRIALSLFSLQQIAE